jgi:hypothetical protein
MEPYTIFLIVCAVLGVLLIRYMGGNNPFTTRLCNACREVINDRAEICPHCHTATGK